MGNSVLVSGGAVSVTSGTVLASGAALQPQAAIAPSGPLTISSVDPQNRTRLDKYLKALNAPLKMGLDAERVANALMQTLQSVIRARPDLAHAQFDFESDNGSIRVTSSSMNASDKAWLQGRFNGNAALVGAVRAFHDDAVSGYTTWADADGTPLSPTELDAVKKRADGLTGFMALFAGLGSTAQSSLMKDGAYYRADGRTMNLGADPGSAAGFLDFMRSVQSAANGTATFVSSSGETMVGVLRMNIFEVNSAAIPSFFPASDTRTVGLSERA